jgi:hypothetical protein
MGPWGFADGRFGCIRGGSCNTHHHDLGVRKKGRRNGAFTLIRSAPRHFENFAPSAGATIGFECFDCAFAC